MDDPKRFWGRVDRPAGRKNCWQWTGAKTAFGYGILMWHGLPQQRTHRVSWELAYGPIPSGMFVLHHCDNPACVRPNHLFLGTQTDNQRDMRAKHRAAKPPIRDQAGQANPASKLTDAAVLAIRALSSEGVQHQIIARAFRVAPSAVSLIVNGKRWRHVRPTVM